MAPVLFFAILFSFVLLIVKMGLDYKRETGRNLSGGASDRTLGTSELKRLLEEAVAEGVAPLEERIERMERSLRRLERAAPPALPPRHEHTLLDDASLAEAPEETPAAPGRRERLA